MMLKFSLRREKDRNFKHIAPGLIPAASIAPKPAVPRTPPPCSPDLGRERPRSALAAAILSSSLTGRTWALPPARPRSLSDSEPSESCRVEDSISTSPHTRSEDCLAPKSSLSTPDHSKDELEFGREEGSWKEDKPCVTQPSSTSSRRVLSPDFSEETSCDSPEARQKKTPVQKSLESEREVLPCRSSPTITSDHPRQAKKKTKQAPRPPVEDSSKHSEELSAGDRKKRNSKDGREQQGRLQEEKLPRLEQEEQHHSRASFSLKSSTEPAESRTELQSLRQRVHELVDENDGLKMTVQRLNVELSHYQTCFSPLTKQESSKPKTESPPPWLLDKKYLSLLLQAYDDKIKEQDTLLQTTEKEVKKLRVHVEEVTKENEKLLDKISKIGAFSQNNCHQLQQQAILVLEENQVLTDQLEAQHVKAKASHSRHRSEVTKLSKQLMLLEAEKQCLQADLDQTRMEAQKYMKDLQAQNLQAHIKDAVTWDEHYVITWKLKRQLEQQEMKNKSKVQELILRVSELQEENRSLTQERVSLASSVKSMEFDLELSRQANSDAARRMTLLKQQKEECTLKEEKTRHFLSSVLSVAKHISQEREHLLHMTLVLQEEKQGFIGRILNGTLRFGKLHEEVKVYRRQVLTKLAALEDAAVGRPSHLDEILHLQKLLRERQEAEETLVQSKREVEEELEVLWQAATREKQETVLDLRPNGDLRG